MAFSYFVLIDSNYAKYLEYFVIRENFQVY